MTVGTLVLFQVAVVAGYFIAFQEPPLEPLVWAVFVLAVLGLGIRAGSWAAAEDVRAPVARLLRENAYMRDELDIPEDAVLDLPSVVDDDAQEVAESNGSLSTKRRERRS